MNLNSDARPDENDDSGLLIVEDAPSRTTDENGDPVASSFASLQDGRPVDDNGNTVLSDAEVSAADGTDEEDSGEGRADESDSEPPL